jgi:ribosomal protein S18 acetylase RimI-like enzyme
MLRQLQSLTLYRRLGRLVASSVTIREATDADMLAVQRWLNPNSNPAQGVDHDHKVTKWVAEVLGRLAGFVELVRHPPENTPYTGYWLFSLNIKPLWRGLGIGEALSRAVIERAAAESAPVLDLLVFEDNLPAIRMYRKLGFEISAIPELEPQLERERDSTGRRRVVMRKRIVAHK